MAGRSIPFAEIKARLMPQLPSLLPQWVPLGRFRGREFDFGSLDGGAGKSLNVSSRTGAWKDWATGETGDVITLYANLRHAGNIRDAARDLGEQLGLSLDAGRRSARPVYVPQSAPPEATEKFAQLPVPDGLARPSLPRHDVAYEYKDTAGRTLGFILRINATATAKKKISPFTYGQLRRVKEHGGVETSIGWFRKHMMRPRPLYGLDLLAQTPDGKDVILVEGEPAALACRRLLPGYVGLTWPGGCGGLEYVDLEPLRGRRVVLWADADQPGITAMTRLATLLQPIAACCAKLDVSGLPIGFDAADLPLDMSTDEALARFTARLPV